MTVREKIEQRERELLSPYATLAYKTRGRTIKIEECDFRTCFSRDRDRILHSKAFRRLTNKTQVYIYPIGDSYRTRLTHTLEVSQIARTITRLLNLNEDLCEAACLGHDLGHTPFGHAGERALNAITDFGFKHNEQSIRVVEKIEKLNLTFEVKDAILSHSTGMIAQTTEGNIVRFADKIAYLNHDIEDAIRAKMLVEEDIPAEIQAGLGATKSMRITRLITNLIENFDGKVKYDTATETLFDMLREFMFQKVYRNSVCKKEEEKAESIVKTLYTYFVKHPDEIPQDFKQLLEDNPPERVSCDYVSSMSDKFCVNLYEELFIPKYWDLS